MTASVLAAVQGHPVLALSNAVGGIAFQTTVLAVADIAHRQANLEHAAASAENMMQTIMLVLLITIVLAGLSSPNVSVGHVHPMSIVLVLAAALAFWLVYRVREQPMWKPHRTAETVEDVPEPESHRESLLRLTIGLVITGTITLVSGGLVASTAGAIVEETRIPEPIMGGLFMAVATSLPELVTCVAAVRRGALTLAVSDIVGGNFFDVLFVAAADIAFLKGSLYHGHGVGMREVFVTCVTILLNVVLLAGLIYRQKHGPGNIGFESALMLAIYIAGFLTLALAM
jgi:cation:H+ antiporter